MAAAVLPRISCAGRIDSVLGMLGGSAMLIDAGPQMRWLCGFNGSAGWLLASGHGNFLFVDGRYTEQSREQVADSGVNADVIHVSDHAALFPTIAKHCDGQDVVIDGGAVDVATFRKLANALGREPKPVEDPTAKLRRSKSDAEVARIERASQITDAALAEVLELDWRRFTERELASRLEIALRAAGADREAFHTIVASGPNGSRPHHEPGERRITDGDSVIVDIGAMIDGYHSDMTRTFFIGQPDGFLLDAYGVVEAAQEAGVRACVAGGTLAGVDAACRAVLAEAKLDHLFVTGTGHGIGLQIHEEPFIGKAATGTLVSADVITVEPGIYCEGVGGIRIEDTVSLDPGGPRRLTLTSKDTSCPR